MEIFDFINLKLNCILFIKNLNLNYLLKVSTIVLEYIVVVKALSSSNWSGDGQTDSVPGVCGYGFVPLSLLGNIVMRNGEKKVCKRKRTKLGVKVILANRISVIQMVISLRPFLLSLLRHFSSSRFR